jgi:hypothetical protein
LTVFVVLVGQGESRTGYIEKGYFALAIVGIWGDLQARSGMHFICFFSTIGWHWQIARYNASGEAHEAPTCLSVRVH